MLHMKADDESRSSSSKINNLNNNYNDIDRYWSASAANGMRIALYEVKQ